jgi:hypothetical protein
MRDVRRKKAGTANREGRSTKAAERIQVKEQVAED